MPFDPTDLSTLTGDDLLIRGRLLASNLLTELTESGLLKAIWAAYTQACEGPLARLGVLARATGPADQERLRFEVACFAAYVLMGQEVPRLIRKRKILGTEPDGPRITTFNEAFSEELSDQLSGARTLNEIVVTGYKPSIEFGWGDGLDVRVRIADYIKRSTVQGVVELYGAKIGDALDYRHSPPLDIVGTHSAAHVINACRTALARTLQA